MGKIKKLFTRKSLKTSFAIYISSCILAALLLSLILSSFCQYGQSSIWKKYQKQYEQSYDEMMNVQFHTEGLQKYFSKTDLAVYNILGMLSVGIPVFCFITSIIITSILFYKKNLQQPLIVLNDAAEKIAENNLDFKIIYDKEDELGKLCSSFEKMRVALQDNNFEMWRQVEERKRLNAAFAHDLRTPLTVLKGQSEMLMKYAPQMSDEKVISTAEMMGRHISRLENYVNTMNDLQRLEDIAIQKQTVSVSDIVKQMQLTGTSVCKEMEFIFQNKTNREMVCVDVPLVMQVYDNLLANAVRFTHSQVTVTVDLHDEVFILTVADNGKGFAPKDLSNATKPFYKAENETDNDHFGMGLNICKILCEKHDGYLELSNDSGAKVVAAFKL